MVSTGQDSVTVINPSRPSLDHREEDPDDVNSEFRHEVYGPDPGDKGWDVYEVRFEPDSPEHPHNWSRTKRWYLTSLCGLLVLNA